MENSQNATQPPQEKLRPTLIIDTREQSPLVFTRLQSRAGTLQSGDYSIAGLEHLFAVERKSVQDLVGSVTGERERFERELHRLRGFRFARLLIVGHESEITTGRYRSGVSPKAILHSVRAFEARYIPVVWQHDPAKAAELVETWAYWFARECLRSVEALAKAVVAEEQAAQSFPEESCPA